MEVKEGDQAPGFQLESWDGSTVSLDQFRGKSAVVLYFYPKADTPGCTAESCSFRDLEAEFRDAGAAVLGVSRDKLSAQKRFAEKYSLPFPLLADTESVVCQTYGVLKEKSMYGKKVMGIERTTFVLDKEGVVRRIYPKVKVDQHADEVLQFVRGL
ncbi:MAG TPA: thioredoxin-dependent thiol peroxidase [Armatimonadota bacterium]|jgi:peroxiredoxin Q/BCP